MKLEPTPREVLFYEPGGAHGRENQARANEGGRSVHFPDGNATIARLLVRSLLPDAVPGATQEDVVTARVDYARLDAAGSPARIRLNSSVVHVAHVGDPGCRTRGGGHLRRGRPDPHGARRARAFWRAGTRSSRISAPNCRRAQTEALAYGIKAPIVYTNVFIRNWTSFAKLGVANITAPSGFHPTVQLAEPVTDWRVPVLAHARGADGAAPGAHAVRAGQAAQGAASARTRGAAVDAVRDVRAGDPRRSWAACWRAAASIRRATSSRITVNRWPHGYTYNYNTLADPVAWSLATPEDRACVVGRQPFGRISIANADAAGSSHTDAAIEQAYRAVREVVESRAAAYVARFTNG